MTQVPEGQPQLARTFLLDLSVIDLSIPFINLQLNRTTVAIYWES